MLQPGEHKRRRDPPGTHLMAPSTLPQGNFNMLLVTPSHATIPDCSEVSPQFNTKSAEGLPVSCGLGRNPPRTRRPSLLSAIPCSSCGGRAAALFKAEADLASRSGLAAVLASFYEKAVPFPYLPGRLEPRYLIKTTASPAALS